GVATRLGAYLSFFFSSRRRHTRFSRDWSSDVCSSDLQSVLKRDYLAVRDVNVEEYIASKNDEFMFNEESLTEAVHRIGRWYDLDIDIDPTLKDIQLWGSLPRRENFGQVLRLIQLTNKHVKVEIEGRRDRFMR